VKLLGKKVDVFLALIDPERERDLQSSTGNVFHFSKSSMWVMKNPLDSTDLKNINNKNVKYLYIKISWKQPFNY
jgi:hypothetical protein